MVDQLAPHSSQTLQSSERLQDSYGGLRPSISDIMRRVCQGKPPTAEDEENGFLKDAGEDPEADLMAFLSYETLPSRVAWSRISRAEYEYVKNVFARRGVPINSDTNKADIIKFKDDLLGCHLYGI